MKEFRKIGTIKNTQFGDVIAAQKNGVKGVSTSWALQALIHPFHLLQAFWGYWHLKHFFLILKSATCASFPKLLPEREGSEVTLRNFPHL